MADIDPNTEADPARLRDEALEALDQNNLSRARALCARALSVLERTAPADRAAVLLVAGWVELAAGDHILSRQNIDAAAACLPTRPEDHDELRLWFQIQLASAEADRNDGNLTEAAAQLATIVELIADAFGPDDDLWLTAWNDLGITWKYAAQYDKSAEAYACVLDRLERDPETDPLQYAALFHNLGGLDHARGRPENGIILAERGLALRREVRGPDHPEVAADLNALGALYHLADRYQDAGDAYHQALTVFETAFGPDHYEVGMTIANLAVLAADEGRLDQAITYGQRCLTILRAVLGNDHPDIGVTLHNLGAAHLDAGQVREAVAVLQDAAKILDASLPEDHPQLSATHDLLAEARAATG